MLINFSKFITHAACFAFLATGFLSAEEANLVPQEVQETTPEAAEQVIKNGLVFGTSHPGAFHQAITLQSFGYFNIELEDGSRWQVAFSDIFEMLNWLPSDILVIVPNWDLTSSFYYRLVNQATGNSVAVNLVDVCTLCSGAGHWMIGYDARGGVVFLEDGSAWEATYFDLILSDRWWTNDRLIIGINTGPDWVDYPNILINARKSNYVRAECIN